MSPQSEPFSILDAIAVVSFCVGLANYSENVSQSQMQDVVNAAVLGIQNHLKAQDEKLNQILTIIQKGENAHESYKADD